MEVTTKILNNGSKIPVLGLGTWQAGDDPSGVEQAIKDAIDAGYRHFDCAWVYRNENVIGKALREKINEGVVKREDLFITTKLWNVFHEPEQVVPACKRSLENFGFDYVDLYLIHWPVAYKTTTDIWPLTEEDEHHVDFRDTWKGMEECYKLGLTKSIGLSNFNSQQIDKILSTAETKPTVNQIEVHPYMNQKKLREFCAKRNIMVIAYSPFGSPNRTWVKPGDSQVIIDRPEILKISKKYGKTCAQVVLRYLIDIGTIPIPKSASKKRLEENINIFDFKLTQSDITTIDRLDCGMRICPGVKIQGFKDYPFDIEF